MATFVEFVGFQRVEPRKANCVHEQGNCDNNSQNLQDIEASVGARKHSKGELHSQEDKDGTVDEEVNDFPGRIRD